MSELVAADACCNIHAIIMHVATTSFQQICVYITHKRYYSRRCLRANVCRSINSAFPNLQRRISQAYITNCVRVKQIQQLYRSPQATSTNKSDSALQHTTYPSIKLKYGTTVTNRPDQVRGGKHPTMARDDLFHIMTPEIRAPLTDDFDLYLRRVCAVVHLFPKKTSHHDAA